MHGSWTVPLVGFMDMDIMLCMLRLGFHFFRSAAGQRCLIHCLASMDFHDLR